MVSTWSPGAGETAGAGVVAWVALVGSAEGSFAVQAVRVRATMIIVMSAFNGSSMRYVNSDIEHRRQSTVRAAPAQQGVNCHAPRAYHLTSRRPCRYRRQTCS